MQKQGQSSQKENIWAATLDAVVLLMWLSDMVPVLFDRYYCRLLDMLVKSQKCSERLFRTPLKQHCDHMYKALWRKQGSFGFWGSLFPREPFTQPNVVLPRLVNMNIIYCPELRQSRGMRSRQITGCAIPQDEESCIGERLQHRMRESNEEEAVSDSCISCEDGKVTPATLTSTHWGDEKVFGHFMPTAVLHDSVQVRVHSPRLSRYL